MSNEEIAFLVDQAPGKFIGFASMDPYREDAEEALEHDSEIPYSKPLEMPKTSIFVSLMDHHSEQ